MRPHAVRTALIWGVAATLLLPVVLAVVLGLGSLLHAVGDAAGARACGRVALGAGAAWLVAVVSTTAISALALLERGVDPPSVRRRRGRRPRRSREVPHMGSEPGDRLG